MLGHNCTVCVTGRRWHRTNTSNTAVGSWEEVVVVKVSLLLLLPNASHDDIDWILRISKGRNNNSSRIGNSSIQRWHHINTAVGS